MGALELVLFSVERAAPCSFKGRERVPLSLPYERLIQEVFLAPEVTAELPDDPFVVIPVAAPELVIY
jgi:hypothetical protein